MDHPGVGITDFEDPLKSVEPHGLLVALRVHNAREAIVEIELEPRDPCAQVGRGLSVVGNADPFLREDVPAKAVTVNDDGSVVLGRLRVGIVFVAGSRDQRLVARFASAAVGVDPDAGTEQRVVSGADLMGLAEAELRELPILMKRALPSRRFDVFEREDIGQPAG